MAERFPFPYSCEYFRHFNTQHEAVSLIEQYKIQDRIKKCAHLHVATFGGGYSAARTYAPGCHKDSFRVEREPRTGRKLFYGCPEDCCLYRPAWKGREELLKEKWWSFQRGITGVAKWYASLSPAAQAILALGLLALMGAPWRNTILEGLKIIFGK